MLKQVLRAMIVLAVLGAMSSPAWAGGINAILDDPTTGGGPFSYYLPYGSNSPYSMTWQTCSPYYNGTTGTSPVPPGELASGYKDCLAITNNTGSAITNLVLDIPDSNPSGTFTSCLVSGSTTGFSCSISSTGSGSSTVWALDFTGIPGFANSTEIYIGVGLPSDDLSGLGNPTVITPTYDPSTLTLLAVGIAMLAMGGIRRYA